MENQTARVVRLARNGASEGASGGEKTSARFPVVIHGAQAGSVLAPRGSTVALLKIDPDGTLEIERQAMRAKVPADSTDLLTRVRLATAASATPAVAPNPNAPLVPNTPGNRDH